MLLAERTVQHPWGWYMFQGVTVSVETYNGELRNYHTNFRRQKLWAYRGNLDALSHDRPSQQQLMLVSVLHYKIMHAHATIAQVSTQLADLRAIFPQANENSWGRQIRDGAKSTSAEGIESRKGAKHCPR